jgi:hypothetical protein
MVQKRGLASALGNTALYSRQNYMYATKACAAENINKPGKMYFILEYTHAFFADSELLIKDYISYLTYTTLVSNYTNHMVLKSSLSSVNQ